MCGIVAYLGKQEAKPILINGLKKVEYRGYDSAGIAIISPKGKVQYQKEVGKISELENQLLETSMEGNIGIAHTRWATHGKPSIENAHPHYDCHGKIWLVHNGIIENYQELKEKLIELGHIFISETDTEVLAHLFEHYYEKLGSLDDAVTYGLNDIRGAYALAVMHEDEPRKLIAIKISSPLRLGIIPHDGYIIASDPSAIISLTNNMITLEDHELLVINDDQYQITHLATRQKIQKEIEIIDWNYESLERGNFSHYMEKEIFEQPRSLEESLKGRIHLKEGIALLGGIQTIQRKLEKIEYAHFVACGTASFAGMIGELLFEEFAQIPAKLSLASEFRYRNSIHNSEKEMVIAISQSGETADTLAAVKEARRQRVLTIGIINTVGSSIARATDAGIYCRVGPEIAVASTKAFTAQTAILALLAITVGRQRHMTALMGQTLLHELARIPEYLKIVLEQSVLIETLAEKYSRYDHFMYMGRKYQYPVACEGALKLKELSYIHAEAFASGELKHGPIALIEEKIPSFFLCPRDSVYEKNISNMQEIKARGGKIIAIATEGDTLITEIANDIIMIPKTLECLTPILSVVPLQLFAYYCARERGCDVDKPRNLAKSVTVE